MQYSIAISWVGSCAAKQLHMVHVLQICVQSLITLCDTFQYPLLYGEGSTESLQSSGSSNLGILL